jgi:hypothetical protein
MSIFTALCKPLCQQDAIVSRTCNELVKLGLRIRSADHINSLIEFESNDDSLVNINLPEGITVLVKHD